MMQGNVVALDPVTWIETTLVDPETDQPFVLNPDQRSTIRRALSLGSDGRLLYPEIVIGKPKKSGKTTEAAAIVLYVVRVLGGRFAEGYCIANDYEQAQGRVYTAICRIIAVSSLLRDDAEMTANKVTFASTGATITAIASDFAGAAGANPSITSFDELWGVTSERGHRLFDEMCVVPTRRISCRLTTTYAGFEGESTLLENLYKRGLQGQEIEPDLYVQPGMLMFWTNRLTAPWQSSQWAEEMRRSLRPNAYLRLIENRWVTSESSLIDMDWWDACIDPGHRPLLVDRALPVWLGVDASTKRDSTAIVACAWDLEANKVRLVSHRVFVPRADDPIVFEGMVEETVEDMWRRFSVREVRFDPFQMQASAQRLAKRGIPMFEFPQSQANLTEASSNLYELIKGQNLILYPDADMRLSASRAIAVETTRGWRIAKEKTSHHIDSIVALGMAALGALSGIARASGRLFPRHLIDQMFDNDIERYVFPAA